MFSVFRSAGIINISMADVPFPETFVGLFNKARYKICVGGRGAGKSESICRYILGEAMQEKMRVLCCREFQTSIRQSVHQLLSDLIIEMGLENFYQVFETEIKGLNGSQIVFAGLKTNIANIKSMHDVKICFVEEAQVVSERSWQVLIPTIRSDDSQIIMALNPELPTDPTYTRFVLNPPKDAMVIKANFYDNPFFNEVLRKEMEDCKARDPIAYRNVWLGEPREAVEGAIYSVELQKAQDEGRIADFHVDLTKPCYTYWDIGEANYMSIWIEQREGLKRYLVDFIQDQYKKVPYYLGLLQQKQYLYSVHVLPHDAEQNRANAEFTTKVMVQRAFPNAKVIVNPNFPGAVATGIEAVRNIFPFVHFDKTRCAEGLHSLRHYHYKVDAETGKSYGREPDHEYSDAADALRMLAMAFRVKEKKSIGERPRQVLPRYLTHKII